MTDRPIVYPGELPRAEDFLGLAKSLIYAVGTLAEATIGSIYTGVAGLAISATGPASMNVIIGRGSIYELEPVDATAYGVLGTDSNTLFKQGINPAPVTLPITAPSTSGYSQYYVIQATFNETDTNSIVPPYFNSASPLVPLSGAGGAGGYQNTLRQDQCVISSVAGTAAPTGTQVVPSVTLGAVPLYVILVNNSTTSITSANWFPHPLEPTFPSLESLKSLFITQAPATQFYVDGSIGNDANDGLSATAFGVGHGPFLTLQGAVNAISVYQSTTGVTVNVAAGTYAGVGIGSSLISSWDFVGAGVGSTNVTVTSSVAPALGYGFNCVNSNVTISGFLIATSVSNCNGIIGNQSHVNINNCNFGSCAGGCISGVNQSLVTLAGEISVTGNSGYFTNSNSGSTIQYAGQSATLTVTFTGPPIFSNATVYALAGGNTLFYPSNMTWAGLNPTGSRYNVSPGGGINTQGSGTSYIPGTVAGTAANSTSITTATGALAGWYL